MPFLLIVLTLFLAGCAPPTDLPADAALTVDPRDRDVWRTAINNTAASSELGYPWAFGVQTSGRFSGPVAQVVRDSTEDMAAPFVEDFLRRNQVIRRLPIAELTGLTEPVAWIGPDELPEDGDPAGWARLQARRPGIRRVSVMSSPGYDATRQRAYVIRYEVCAPEVQDCYRGMMSLEVRRLSGRWTPWRVNGVPKFPGW